MKQNAVVQIGRAETFTGRVILLALWAVAASTFTARADETCSSPYLARIEGQEEFVYVWTLGVEGLGDGKDKLVTEMLSPARRAMGK